MTRTGSTLDAFMAEQGVIGFVVHGAPRTKKNSSRVVRAGRAGRLRIIPSEPHERWKAQALPQLRIVKGRLEGVTPFSDPVNVRADFYRDAKRGDAVGYYQALADLLQAARIVSDDKWIVSWDGSRMLVDRLRPRIEVWINLINRKGAAK